MTRHGNAHEDVWFVCNRPDCHKRHRAKGYCETHYNEWRRTMELFGRPPRGWTS